MVSLLKLKFRLLKDNKMLYIIMIGMSLLLAGVFGNAFGGDSKSTIVIVDEFNSVSTGNIINKIESSGTFKVKLSNFEDGIKMVSTREALLLLKVDKDIEMYELKPSIESYQIERFVLNSMEDELRLREFSKKVQKIIIENSSIDKNYDEIGKEIEKSMEIHQKNKNIFLIESSLFNLDPFSTYDPKIHYTIGMTIFFVTYSLMFTVGDFLEDRRLHTLDRMRVAPISRFTIFISNIVPAFVIGSLQVTLMILVGKFIFGIQWGKQIWAVIGISIIYVFTMTALSFLIVSRVKTMSQLSSISPIILTGMAMLGGCMWPLEIINSKILILLSNLTPHKWAISGIEKLMVSGHITEEIVFSMGILFGMGILFLLGSVKLSKE